MAIGFDTYRDNTRMWKFTKANIDPWPYAASSTGIYRGLLARKYSCWEAHGPAREMFLTQIAGKIKHCLEQCLPESVSFVGYSLFMVGKSSNKTKPYIMIVSDDKKRRKAAFQLIKSKNLMAEYPGFELGHCSLGAEFEDLQQLGEGDNDIHGVISESSDPQEPMGNLLIANDSQQLPLLEVCTTHFPCKTGPIKIGFHTPSGHHANLATCGGLFTFRGQPLSLTVAHILPRTDMAEGMATTSGLSLASLSDSSSDSDDCEMTGMDDWDDDEERNSESLTTTTSASSCSPSRHSDNEDSPVKNNDWPSPSEADISEAQPLQRVDSPLSLRGAELGTDTGSEICEQIGTVVTIERELDLALISITVSTTERVQSHKELLLLTEDYKDDILDTPVTVKTTHNAAIQGRRSETPIFMRLPGTKSFQLLYSIQLSIPIRAGDCGSWVFNEVSGKFVGFVVAGSPKTGLCLVSPARVALEKMMKLLEGDARLRIRLASRAPFRPLFVLPNPREALSHGEPTLHSLAAPSLLERSPHTSSSGTEVSLTSLPVVTNGQLAYRIPGTERLETPIRIDIQAVIDKGFFLSDGDWTCYRRNYFSCICSYSLTPNNTNSAVRYTPNEGSTVYQVLGFAMSISAVEADDDHRSVDLVLHTPKSYRGPPASPDKIRLSPKSLQETPDLLQWNKDLTLPTGTTPVYKVRDGQKGSQEPYVTEHTFERVQFKQATANNGKRRAAQQYFQLVVKLYADVGTQNPDHQFMEIASRKSPKLIVRGRSPANYQTGGEGTYESQTKHGIAPQSRIT